jgi:2-oxoglutarate dehydrogenase complex dehydrogenase (E1) component-like enzyme
MVLANPTHLKIVGNVFWGTNRARFGLLKLGTPKFSCVIYVIRTYQCT